MKVDFKGLKFKNWMYLMIFSIFILIVLWVLQFAFLNNFYQRMKLNEIVSIGNQIVSKYEDNEDFNQTLNEYAYKNNLKIVLFNESQNIAMNFDGSDLFNRNPLGNRLLNEFSTIMNQFEESGSDKVHFLTSDDRREMSQAVYIAKVSAADGSTNYLYISNPIPPIDSTLSVLKTQFILITIIIFILSLIAAQLISRKMARPIIKLTKSAEKLAKGDLNVDFYDGGFTEIHQLSSTLSYATNELSKLDNYRKEFIANVSHDLKTPLTIIKFYGEMIRDVSGNHPEKRNSHCETIVKEADWLSEMVNEILELSKLESDNVQLKKTDFNISRCLLNTLCSFQVLSDKENYVFDIDIDEDLIVRGNEQYLKRVLYNLISNAVNYTGDDKLVKVSLKNAGNKIRFEVTDTGQGIPEDKVNEIWERYYKSNETHKRAVVGTGLGLSIAKNALELHEAEYGVESAIDNGSTFWFELDKQTILSTKL